jgi:hypothetical protein
VKNELEPDELRKELEKLKKKILEIAVDMDRKGAGYAQQGVVLRAAEKQYGGDLQTIDDRFQQALRRWQFILTAWHDLFRDGELSWGYDLDNPDSPFFHVPLLKKLEQPVAAS